jgi:hypothetical protein
LLTTRPTAARTVSDVDSKMRASGVSAGGAMIALTGLGFIAAGVWGRREVRASLARERIANVAGQETVTTGTAARALAETIRSSTLSATGGHTYAEIETDGSPDQVLWLQSMTLQTALMQAYMGTKVAELTAALGLVFVGLGAGLAASAHGR